jgi:hypothetical protein
LPEPEKPLLSFQLPEHEDKEIYLIRLEDGTVVARTKEELSSSQAQPKASKK